MLIVLQYTTLCWSTCPCVHNDCSSQHFALTSFACANPCTCPLASPTTSPTPPRTLQMLGNIQVLTAENTTAALRLQAVMSAAIARRVAAAQARADAAAASQASPFSYATHFEPGAEDSSDEESYGGDDGSQMDFGMGSPMLPALPDAYFGAVPAGGRMRRMGTGSSLHSARTSTAGSSRDPSGSSGHPPRAMDLQSRHTPCPSEPDLSPSHIQLCLEEGESSLPSQAWAHVSPAGPSIHVSPAGPAARLGPQHRMSDTGVLTRLSGGGPPPPPVGRGSGCFVPMSGSGRHIVQRLQMHSEDGTMQGAAPHAPMPSRLRSVTVHHPPAHMNSRTFGAGLEQEEQGSGTHFECRHSQE